jgi:hypothetical protein
VLFALISSDDNIRYQEPLAVQRKMLEVLLEENKLFRKRAREFMDMVSQARGMAVRECSPNMGRSEFADAMIRIAADTLKPLVADLGES